MGETFAQALKRLRTDRELSQPELARKVPISQASLSRYESTKQTPDETTAQRLDDVLGARGVLTALAQAQRRWLAAGLTGTSHTHAEAVLERAFRAPLSIPAPTGGGHEAWQRHLIALSAERARDFLFMAEATTVGSESLDQLVDDVRRLARAYPLEPLDTLLGGIVDAQHTAFNYLEGRQYPQRARDLYLLAGVLCGLMAKASHDLGAPDDALTQARTAYVCADNAGHDGLRAWTRGLQSLICYWSGRLEDSVRYAEQGQTAAAHSRGTSVVWLAANQARSLAALGRMADAQATITRATEARDNIQPDELDEFGGLCTFTRPRQLYYAADAFRWGGTEHAESAEIYALDAIDAYRHASEDEYAFSDEAGARCALAAARIGQGHIDGAAEAIGPVLDLPEERRIHGIVSSVNYVHELLAAREIAATSATQLGEAMHVFSEHRLVIPR